MVTTSPVPVDKRPKDLRPYNDAGDLVNTPVGKRNRKPPTRIYTPADRQQPSSPLASSPIASRTNAAATYDCLNPFLGNRVAVKIGALVFFGNIKSCRWYEGTKVQEKLWLIVYDNKEEEEVNISQLSARQRLYCREQQYDTDGNRKPKAKVSSTPSTKIGRASCRERV